jgi:hypothetical protein
VVLAENVNTQPHIISSLITGTTYKFYIEARNAVGYSAQSSTYQIIAATVPTAPATPTTSILNNDITIDWDAPAENGQTILGYRIYIKQSDSVFTQSLGSCDGSTFEIIV